jgi:hypothetical protein
MYLVCGVELGPVGLRGNSTAGHGIPITIDVKGDGQAGKTK